MNTAIVVLQDFEGRVAGQIAHVYTGEPDQTRFGGPYGNPLITKHVDIGSMTPVASVLEADIDAITGEILIVENTAAKTAYQQEQIDNQIKTALARHESACQSMFTEFKLENAKLGIKADAAKEAVLQKLAPVLEAVNSGDADLVIDRMKAVDPADYDGKYVTAARLLKFVNMLETSLGYTLSTSL